MMNAVMHRDYQANMPTRLYQYDNHIEIMNPGGLYGQARPENFPHVNDYRNSVVAGMMKTLNYVNMFNHGVGEVQDLLKANNSPEATFNVNYLTAFSVVVREPDESSLPKLAQVNGKAIATENQEIMNKLFQAFPNFGKAHAQVISMLLQACKTPSLVKDIMAASGIASRTTFDRVYFIPIKEIGLVTPTYPDNPRHPQQKYYLTELGKQVLSLLSEDGNTNITN